MNSAERIATGIERATGRDVIFCARVGSHNYGLNVPGSDEDFIVFVAPTFDEIVFNKMFFKENIGATDYRVYDIRRMTEFIEKSNANNIEILFSDNMYINSRYKEIISSILLNSDSLVKYDLKRMYNSHMGIYRSKRAKLTHSTDSTRHLVEKYGYNTKEAMHALRYLQILWDYGCNNFEGYDSALRPTGFIRKHLMEIRTGIFSIEYIERELDAYYSLVKVCLENRYMARAEMEDPARMAALLKDVMRRIIKEVIKNDGGVL